MSLLLKFTCPENDKYSVVVDDDDKVAYAYFLENERITGDVWLYNVHPTPLLPAWLDRTNMPLMPVLNSREFVLEPMISPVSDAKDVQVIWDIDDGGQVESAGVFIRGVLECILKPGSRPGWSHRVKRDGPTAKTIPRESWSGGGAAEKGWPH